MKTIGLKQTTAKDLMKSFHKRDDMLCEYGCGKPSTYVISGVGCCNKYPHRCPSFGRYHLEKKLEFIGQIPHRKMKDTKFSCFNNYFFNEEWYLHQIIGLVKWGSNRVIRQQGFRVLPITQELKLIKK